MQPADDQLVDLERLLHQELSDPEIALDEKRARQAYGFRLDRRFGFLGVARHVLGLDAIPDYEAVVSRAFEQLVSTNSYNSEQIRFLRAVQDVFMMRGRLTSNDLREPPLTAFGRNAVDRYFTPEQIDSIVSLTGHLAA